MAQPTDAELVRAAREGDRAAGASVAGVRIVRLTDMVFYAEILLAGGAAVDARPTDALNLALVTGVPIGVDRQVLAEADRTAARMSDDVAATLDLLS